MRPRMRRAAAAEAEAPDDEIADQDEDVVIKLPRYDYDEIIDALEGEEDDAADSGGEDYELAG